MGNKATFDLADLPDVSNAFGEPIPAGEYNLVTELGIGIGWTWTGDEYCILLRMDVTDAEEPGDSYSVEDFGLPGYYFDLETVCTVIDSWVKQVNRMFPQIQIEKLGDDF